MKAAFSKTVDIICIMLELIFQIVILPFRVIKAIYDITKIATSK